MSPLNNLTDAEKTAIEKALISHAFQLLIGIEEWDLSEPEEEDLWSAIRKIESSKS